MRELLFHGPNTFCLLMAAGLALHLAVKLLRPAAMPFALQAVSSPVLRCVGWLTPLGCPGWLLSLVAIFWLLALRVVLHLQLGAWGLLPGQATP
jgi:hypothetical protein